MPAYPTTSRLVPVDPATPTPLVPLQRGPELFVPTSSGRIETARGGRGPVSVTVNVAAPAGSAPQFMARSGRQVARAVRDAIEKAG